MTEEYEWNDKSRVHAGRSGVLHEDFERYDPVQYA